MLIALVGRVPRLDGDVAVSVVITSLFGLGVLLGLAPEVPAGLNGILFGDVLGVTDLDIALAAGLAVGVVAVLTVLHPSLLVTGFDRLNARALGRSPAALDVVLALLLAAATLVAVQALGNLLVVAMLVGPAATARLLTRRMAPMMITATAVAAGAAVAGLYASYHARVAAGAAVDARARGVLPARAARPLGRGGVRVRPSAGGPVVIERGAAWAERAHGELAARGYRSGGARSAVIDRLAGDGGCRTAAELARELRARRPAGRDRERLPRARRAPGRRARPRPGPRRR